MSLMIVNVTEKQLLDIDNLMADGGLSFVDAVAKVTGIGRDKLRSEPFRLEKSNSSASQIGGVCKLEELL